MRFWRRLAWLTYLLTYLLNQSITQSCWSWDAVMPYDGVCSCSGLDVQDIQRSWLVHDNGNRRVDVRRGTVLTRPCHHRRVQRQPAVQGLLFHRLGWANCLVSFSLNVACCMVSFLAFCGPYVFFFHNFTDLVVGTVRWPDCMKRFVSRMNHVVSSLMLNSTHIHSLTHWHASNTRRKLYTDCWLTLP